MRAFLYLIAPILAALPVSVRGETEWRDDRVHAPVPLYTFDWEDIWPRSIVDPEPGTLFGCESRVAFGDWRFVPAWARNEDDGEWLRWGNYGVIHCAGNVWRADTRDALGTGEYSRGFFVRLGEGRAQGKLFELWALQEGFVPGSSYTLLARAAADGDGLVNRFDVLQRRCPSGKERKASGFDSWLTRYCAVETRADLLALARKMLREPFLGELVLVKEKGPEAEASDPSNSD